MLFIKAPLHSLRKTKAFQFLLSSRLNKPKFCDIGFGHKVALRPLTHASIRWKKNRLEPNIRRLICKVLLHLNKIEKDVYFFDIGANIGLYTWEVQKKFPNNKIISFEPDPKNFELLKMTNSKIASSKVELQNFALSDISSEAEFLQDNLTSATGTLEKEETPWIEKYLKSPSKKIIVYTIKMDEFVRSKKIPSLIKLDVEGHELKVLHGAERTLHQSRPILIFESFPPNQEKVITFLAKKGYQIYDADRLCHVNQKTNNLIAFHPSGSISNETFSKCILQ